MREILHSSPVQQITPPAALLLLALVARVAYVSAAPQIDPILQRDPLYGDASGYQLLAENLLKGLGLTWDGLAPTSYRMPGYPAFLALIYSAVGANLQVIRLAQALLGALTCIPVYAVGKRLGGTSVAAMSGLGVALHPMLIYMTGWVYSETLFLLLLWTGLCLLARMPATTTQRAPIAAGIMFGLAVLVRPEIALFPTFLGAIGVIFRLPRRLLGMMLVVQFATVVLLLPWAGRNAMVHNAIVPLTTSTGSNLYAGNNPQSNGGSAWSKPLPGLSELDSDRELGKRAVGWILGDPVDAASNVAKKLIKFFSPMEMEFGSSPFSRWTLPFDLAYTLFLLLALAGASKCWREGTGMLLISLISWYTLTAIVFYGGTRVAMPVTPAFVILCAMGIHSLILKLKRVSSVRPSRPSAVGADFSTSPSPDSSDVS